jgi:hypothetical protein
VSPPPPAWLPARAVPGCAGVPMESLTVCRGVKDEVTDRRMSWTLDLDEARWFGDRFRVGVGVVYRALVPPPAVLARFETRRESEVVINPNMLRGRVEVLDRRSPGCR